VEGGGAGVVAQADRVAGGERPQVHPGAERPVAGPGQDHGPHLGVGLGRRQRGAQGHQQRGGEGVAGVGPVEPQDHHVATPLLDELGLADAGPVAAGLVAAGPVDAGLAAVGPSDRAHDR
jgi:hypothetical protein